MTLQQLISAFEELKRAHVQLALECARLESQAELLRACVLPLIHDATPMQRTRARAAIENLAAVPPRLKHVHLLRGPAHTARRELKALAEEWLLTIPNPRNRG